MAGEPGRLGAACAAVLLLTSCHIVQANAAWQDTSGSDDIPDCSACTIDYNPVCGTDNSTYANKCYAECQGAWTPGRCPDELNPVAGCIGVARCAGNPCDQPWPSACQNRLPADAVCFLNACNGIEYQGQQLAPCAPLWVDPATKQVVRCGGPVTQPCVCTKELKPVCGSNGKMYGNKCLAACELGANGNWTDGACKKPCICTLEYAPVCGSNGKTYSNKCAAACELGAGGNWTDGECRKPCICNKEYAPVCGSDGETYSNACSAACELGNDGNWTDGPCRKPCICPMISAPVCGSDGNTYSNGCTAGCQLGDSGTWTDGECKDPCICTEQYTPVCGSDGNTYSNPCFAACALGAEGNWTDGACGGDLNPFAGCLGNVRCKRNPCDDGCADAPDGAVCFMNTCTGQALNGEPVDACAAVWVDPVTKAASTCPAPKQAISCSSNATVACFANPCSVSSCPADAEATCLASYCAEGTFRGEPVGPCEAVYVDADGNRVNCDATVRDLPAVNCSSNATVACFADPCSVSSCAADAEATCLASYCTNGTFQGEPVGPCEAIYVDADGNRVNCDAVEPYLPAITCLSDIVAQCAADPCAMGSCPADPTATCLASYCGEGSFQGQPVGPCEAVYVNRWGRRVNCTGPNEDIYQCDPDSALYKCVTPLPCDTAVCPGTPNAMCITKSCRSTYRGVDLPACSAIWVDRDTGDLVTPETCDAPPPPPSISCPSDATVLCFADPCSVSSCAAEPTATCLASYCADGLFRGEHVGPCEAVYVDADGNRVDCAPPAEDTYACSPASPRFMCKTPSACENATCPAFPGAMCVTKPCSSTYRGVDLPACSAIWVDRDTGDLIPQDACDGPQPQPTIFCLSKATVACFAEPCSVSSCAAEPTATCLASYCADGLFRGEHVGPCEAVYVSDNGSRVNCSPPAEDIYSCPPDAPRVMCTRENSNPCANATCPGFPGATCISKPCASTFAGVDLYPCSPIWVTDVGELVTTCEPVHEPAVSCPTDVPTVHCLDDPCTASRSMHCPAAAVAGAVCETSVCPHGLLVTDGSPVAPCNAVWTMPNGTATVCFTNTPFSRPDCICPALYQPVCTTRGQAFDSPCSAQCAGQEVAYDGECRDDLPDGPTQSTAPPSSPPSPPQPPSRGREDCFCTMQYDPVCGKDGKTYGNACEAGCAEVEVEYEGVCTSLPSCPKNKTVQCFADPCRVSTCKAEPSARCLPSYCSEGSFQDQPIGPCEAVYVDIWGNRVNCDAPKIICAPEAFEVGCFADPCSVSSCPADPTATCLASYCTAGTFQDQPVSACEAVYADASGKRVDCQLQPARACPCPFTWDPVCARYNYTSRTYPNSCAAACANATIRKTGKCQHCNGIECDIGKMNDVCFLAAPSVTQCWDKKYECRPTDGTPADMGLGRCLPKDNSTAAATTPSSGSGQSGRRLHRHLLTERELSQH